MLYYLLLINAVNSFRKLLVGLSVWVAIEWKFKALSPFKEFRQIIQLALSWG